MTTKPEAALDRKAVRLLVRDAALRGTFYPRPACAACGQPDPEWTKTAGPRAAEEITEDVLKEEETRRAG